MGIGLKAEKISILNRKLRRNLEDYGWVDTVAKSLAFFFKLFHFNQVYRIYRINLEKSARACANTAMGFVFRLLSAEDFGPIEQIESVAEWLRGKLRARILSGDLCLVALEGEKVAGFNLITFGQVFIPLINLRRTFRPGEAWSEHIAVRKEYRQRGLGSHLRYGIFDELRRRGTKRLYGGTLRSNLPSLRLARSVGFSEVLDVSYRRILGLEFWRYTRVRN